MKSVFQINGTNWFIVCCFQHYFIYIMAAFPGVFCNSFAHTFLSKLLAAFMHNELKKTRQKQ